MKAFEHIKLGKSDENSVFSVSLSRPAVGNAMSDLTLRELTRAFEIIAADAGARAVVVLGMGKNFCTGADIEWMRRAGTLPPAEGKKDARLLYDMLSAVRDCPVPVVVAAQGAVYGGGLGLVAAADIAISCHGSRFAFSECRLGIMPAVISCFVLPKIGIGAARRFYLTAEAFETDAAMRIGLISEIVPAPDFLGRAYAIAGEVAKNGPQAVRAAKDLLLRFDDWQEKDKAERVIETLVRLRSSPEGQEGLSAFLEKRKPSWHCA